MKTMTAAEAKNGFGKFFDMARRESVLVTKNNRPVGMMISIEDLSATEWGCALLKRFGLAEPSPETGEGREGERS